MAPTSGPQTLRIKRRKFSNLQCTLGLFKNARGNLTGRSESNDIHVQPEISRIEKELELLVTEIQKELERYAHIHQKNDGRR